MDVTRQQLSKLRATLAEKERENASLASKAQAAKGRYEDLNRLALSDALSEGSREKALANLEARKQELKTQLARVTAALDSVSMQITQLSSMDDLEETLAVAKARKDELHEKLKLSLRVVEGLRTAVALAQAVHNG